MPVGAAAELAADAIGIAQLALCYLRKVSLSGRTPLSGIFERRDTETGCDFWRNPYLWISSRQRR